MVTFDNIKELIESIDPEIIKRELNKSNDCILFEAHIFNTGSYATIESTDYDDEIEQEAGDNGQLFTDKDSFIQLCNCYCPNLDLD